MAIDNLFWASKEECRYQFTGNISIKEKTCKGKDKCKRKNKIYFSLHFKELIAIIFLSVLFLILFLLVDPIWSENISSFNVTLVSKYSSRSDFLAPVVFRGCSLSLDFPCKSCKFHDLPLFFSFVSLGFTDSHHVQPFHSCCHQLLSLGVIYF